MHTEVKIKTLRCSKKHKNRRKTRMQGKITNNKRKRIVKMYKKHNTKLLKSNKNVFMY